MIAAAAAGAVPPQQPPRPPPAVAAGGVPSPPAPAVIQVPVFAVAVRFAIAAGCGVARATTFDNCCSVAAERERYDPLHPLQQHHLTRHFHPIAVGAAGAGAGAGAVVRAGDANGVRQRRHYQR